MNSTFEQQLEENGVLIFTNVGDSMMPLLRQGRDILIIRKTTGRLKKYDVPLFKRDTGEYVLHRILKVRPNDYVTCGDNRFQSEGGITDRHILGVLTGVIRDGKEISVTDWRYRLYVHLWCDFFYVRAAILGGKHLIRSTKRRLKRRFCRK